jgi:hypothetical protein
MMNATGGRTVVITPTEAFKNAGALPVIDWLTVIGGHL